VKNRKQSNNSKRSIKEHIGHSAKSMKTGRKKIYEWYGWIHNGKKNYTKKISKKWLDGKTFGVCVFHLCKW